MPVHPNSKIEPNPRNWRWMLARYLLGGKIEVMPLFPNRPINHWERLIVHLGGVEAFNTVEVHTDMPANVTELIEMKSINDAIPNTFIALDLEDEPGYKPSLYRVVGTFRGWTGTQKAPLIILEKAGGESVMLRPKDIKKAYWAPAGYRP